MESELHIVRIAGMALSLLGVLVFGGLLVFILASPLGFEERAKGFLIQELEREFSKRTPMPATAWVETVPNTLSPEVEARLQETLAGLSEFIVASVAAMCRMDCVDRAQLEASLKKIYNDRLADLMLGVAKLRGMVESKYHAALAELRLDVIIFGIGNLVAMLLALVLSLIRGEAADHLLPIASILTLSTLTMSYWHVFGQNWVLTIIYSDHFGWSYLVCLGVLCLLLIDIGVNRARITSMVLNSISNVIGIDFSWSPC